MTDGTAEPALAPPPAEPGVDGLLDVRGISKAFSGVRVLENVDLKVRPRRLLCLIGENGAGKSTLMKIVAGVHRAGSFDGEVRLGGRRVAFSHPSEARRAGIVFVPQELQIAPELPIAENMFRGQLPSHRGVVDRAELRSRARAALEFFGITVDPRAPARLLAPSEQRLMLIAAALSEEAKLLILDEPTAALTESEGARLFEHVHAVKLRGIGCVHITHRLEEVEREADDIVVMRNGRVVSRFHGDERPSRSQLVRALIGRESEPVRRHAQERRREPILEVRDLVVRDPSSGGRSRVDGLSFQLHRGEILGIFGLVGAGRTEMARAIFGAWPGERSGEVHLEGRPLDARHARDAIAAGLAMLPEDRKASGVVQGQSVNANISAASIARVSGRVAIDRRRERRRNRALVQQLDIRPPRLDAPVETLSGGNQQKVMLARCLATEPDVLILDEPTFGVDVGARFDLYRIVRELADGGRAVLLISSDLDEVLTECDRILVMYNGRITGEFGAGASRHDLMAAATGGTQ